MAREFVRQFLCRDVCAIAPVATTLNLCPYVVDSSSLPMHSIKKLSPTHWYTVSLFQAVNHFCRRGSYCLWRNGYARPVMNWLFTVAILLKRFCIQEAMLCS